MSSLWACIQLRYPYVRFWPIATFREVRESTQYRGSVADIMITPAISVLSAVEGLQLAFDGITF